VIHTNQDDSNSEVRIVVGDNGAEDCSERPIESMLNVKSSVIAIDKFVAKMIDSRDVEVDSGRKNSPQKGEIS
jgi:hypothetical protein